MSWARLDDRMHMHPKVIGLDDATWRAYVESILESCFMRSQGRIHARVALRWGAAAEALVRAGLWEVAEDGYLIHDFAQYNSVLSDTDDRPRRRPGRPRRPDTELSPLHEVNRRGGLARAQRAQRGPNGRWLPRGAPPVPAVEEIQPPPLAPASSDVSPASSELPTSGGVAAPSADPDPDPRSPDPQGERDLRAGAREAGMGLDELHRRIERELLRPGDTVPAAWGHDLVARCLAPQDVAAALQRTAQYLGVPAERGRVLGYFATTLVSALDKPKQNAGRNQVTNGGNNDRGIDQRSGEADEGAGAAAPRARRGRAGRAGGRGARPGAVAAEGAGGGSRAAGAGADGSVHGFDAGGFSQIGG